jgi:biopolymer transport protein ExbD
MAPKTLAKMGLAAVVAAVAVSPWTDHWLKTRTQELINRPVSVKNGIVNSGAFEIEHEQAYWFEIGLDSGIDDWIGGSCSSKRLQKADWRIYRLDNKETAKTELWINSLWFYGRQRGFAYEFTPEAGKYWLQWDAPGDAHCLNAQHPRLRIWTLADEDEFQSALIQDACLFFGGIGVALVLLGRSGWMPSDLADKRIPRMFPEMALRNAIAWKRHRPLAKIRDLPNFGMVYGFVLWVLVFLFMIFVPLKPKGLLVDFRGVKAVGVGKSPWTETLGVYVDAKRGFLVNQQLVAREELRARLQEELLRRGIWVVYFEADPNCLFMDAAYAIDTIQGLGAKMIWITPKTREEWKQKSNP